MCGQRVKLLAGFSGLAVKGKTHDGEGEWLVAQAKATHLINMRRHGDLYDKITSMDNLQLAFKNASKGKNWQRAVQEFKADSEGRLTAIRKMLVNDTYRPSPYRLKQIYIPKTRDIYIAPFYPDRVIHHALMNVIEPIWDKLFIEDSYACRKGRGLHGGSSRTMEFVRRNQYCLKCDIKKFYPSMNHDILFEIVERKIKCKRTLNLIHMIIYSIPGGQNVPIGNYTSQWFGNLYLNELDQRMKHLHHIKDYVRYCDDFLLFHKDKRVLRSVAGDIKSYVENTLKMRLSQCELFPVSHGVDFLGYRHFPGYVLLRKSTATRMRRRLKVLPRLFAAGRITLEQFRSSVASMMGWIKWANTRNFKTAIQIDNLVEFINGSIGNKKVFGFCKGSSA